MTRNFTVGAVAVPSRRANAVGAVRLTLASDALEIELLRVARFAAGFVPGTPADPTLLRVPYLAVRGLVRDKGTICLALDPAAVTPYNRFALTHFTRHPETVLAHGARIRLLHFVLTYIVPVALAATSVVVAPNYLVTGVVGLAALGAVVAAASWLALREIISQGFPFGLATSRLGNAFEAELSARLGLVAGPAASKSGVASPKPLPTGGAALPSRPPFAAPTTPPQGPHGEAVFFGDALRFPVLGGVVALAAVLLALFLQRYGHTHAAATAVPLLRTGLAALARERIADPAPPPVLPRCSCLRANSPLWERPLPAISVLLFEGERKVGPPMPKLSEGGGGYYKFDVAAVNNASRPFRDLRITITFARRTANGARRGAVDRGLFWEGALLPGHAVKWHVQAPGNEMRVDTSVTETLEGARLDPAPADAFFKLTSSRNRAVVQHAAVLLAYLHDRRAMEVIRSLAVDAEAADETLARLRRAAQPVIVCDVRREGAAIDACLFNGSETAHEGVALVDVPPENGAAPRLEIPVPVPVPIHDGVRVHGAAPPGVNELAVRDPALP